MTRPLILRLSAEADVVQTFEELEKVRAGLGSRFLKLLRDVLVRIEATPEMYGLVWQDVRAARLKRSRHIVYYLVCDDRVEVIAVMHGSRDASAWQTRL